MKSGHSLWDIPIDTAYNIILLYSTAMYSTLFISVYYILDEFHVNICELWSIIQSTVTCYPFRTLRILPTVPTDAFLFEAPSRSLPDLPFEIRSWSPDWVSMPRVSNGFLSIYPSIHLSIWKKDAEKHKQSSSFGLRLGLSLGLLADQLGWVPCVHTFGFVETYW